MNVISVHRDFLFSHNQQFKGIPLRESISLPLKPYQTSRQSIYVSEDRLSETRQIPSACFPTKPCWNGSWCQDTIRYDYPITNRGSSGSVAVLAATGSGFVGLWPRFIYSKHCSPIAIANKNVDK